jgi:hypothetical protein
MLLDANTTYPLSIASTCSTPLASSALGLASKYDCISGSVAKRAGSTFLSQRRDSICCKRQHIQHHREVRQLLVATDDCCVH